MLDITDDPRLAGIDSADKIEEMQVEDCSLDRSRKYRAAVETIHGVSVSGLCRLWDNWRDSPHLTWMLHGFMMITPLNVSYEVWKEIDFLSDILRVEE